MSRRNGRIEVITGPMFAGKTSELLRRITILKYRNRSCLLFKPKSDTRYSETKVVSHDKKEQESITVGTAQEILDILEQNPKIRNVAIDEAQFFNKEEKNNLFSVVSELKQRQFFIIINGLDMDQNGNPFGVMPELMAIADDVSKLKAVCMASGCEKDATMSWKKNNDDTQYNKIELGEKDIYQARCHYHWMQKD